MRHLRIIHRYLPIRHYTMHLMVGAVAFSSLAGAGTTGLIVLIHRKISGEPMSVPYPVLVFFALLAGHGLLGIAAVIISQKTAQRFGLDLQIQMSRRYLNTPVKVIEGLGVSRTMTWFTQLKDALVDFSVRLHSIVSESMMLIGLLVYMGWLQPVLLAVFLAFLGIGCLVYLLPLDAYRRYRQRLYEACETYNSKFHDMVHGVKELAQSEVKKHALLHRHLIPAGERQMNVFMRITWMDACLGRWADIYALLGLGFVLFFLSEEMSLTSENLRDFLLLSLLTLGPIKTIIITIFQLQHLKFAIDQHARIGLNLLEDTPPAMAKDSPWDGARSLHLQLSDVIFTYPHTDRGAPFTTGPVSLTIDGPKIVCVTGGNGSGKSTLARRLCGLYTPDAGSITVNGLRVDEENHVAYRQLFSVIFFDFYLFDTLLGLEHLSIEDLANAYARRLMLSHQVSVRQHAFSTTGLSQGQHRRLALLHARMEDRPIYLFDECAADQDPGFKAVFYREILQELKRDGKIVFVITHDDAYFDVADQLIKLEDGRVTETSTMFSATPLR